MEINKLIITKLELPIFVVEIQMDISHIKNYLINKIEEGVKNSNLNFTTNVRGFMTDWKYFINDKHFINVLIPALKEINNVKKIENFIISDAWGIKMIKGNRTLMHNHETVHYSGILYLNDNDVNLRFSQINLKIKPKEGSLVLFSSILLHGSDKNNSDVIKYAIPFNLLKVQEWDL